jgi:hypothetical protein
MTRNKPTKQHYVPQCYLREWADPNVPSSKEPYVWIFDKDGKNKRRDKVKNVLLSKDLYTIKIEGQKSYFIEETLAELESHYAQVFRDKIRQKLPLSEHERIVLCAFVSAMLQRTLRHKDNLEGFYDQLIELMERMEKAKDLPSTKSDELKLFKENSHKLGVVQLLPDITELLLKMSVAFLCAEKRAMFITSDDPCNLFNPDLQWQRFYGPGLLQKNIQVTLPLSPQIMLCLSWSNVRGYILTDKSRVEDANRMVRGHSYNYFISNTSKIKKVWFRQYPSDFFFMLKVFRRKLETILHKV